MSGEYFLGSSEWSGARLRLQHELTKTNFDRHVLDPSIPGPKPGMAIADVACGTGVWLSDMVERTPNLEADGLDITLAETPPKAWLPDNLSFSQFDILAELPEEYVGRYDIVSMQFGSSFIRDPHSKQAMTALVKMLKPGGYLQITDAEVVRWTCVTANNDSNAPEWNKLYRLIGDIFGGYQQWTWLNDIDQTFKDAGLEEVVVRRPKPKMSTLQTNMTNIMLAQLETSEILAKHPTLKARSVEQKEQRSRAAQEARESGTGLDLGLIRCVGRKPLS